MKTTRITLFALLLLGVAAGAGFAAVSSVGVSLGPSGRSTVNLGFFYDDLAPYGNWVQSPSYGWVWTPLGVADTWRPYEDGHWAWTDQGWTWLSDEPFGWATYHYGRWYDDSTLGWSWVPGYEWAPSWVSFMEAPDYIGWAPLPPSVRLVSGFNGGRIALAPASYVFVPEREFLAPSIVDFAVPAPRVLPIWRTARNVTFYRLAGDRVFVTGVPVERIARFGRVPRFRVADFGPDLRLRAPRIQGDRIAFFRPQVRRTFVAAPSLRPAARRSVVRFDDFRRIRGRSAQAPPPWGRRGLAPGQLRNGVPPPRATARLKSRPDHIRAVRQFRSAPMKAAPRQHARPAERIKHARPPQTMKHNRPAVRSQHVRRAPAIKHAQPAPRLRHARPGPSMRQHARSAPQRIHARPGPSMRQHVRSAPQRMHARPAARQHQQARPARQQARPGRHRPAQ